MIDNAIEAAARAIEDVFDADMDAASSVFAQAAITAYLAAKEKEAGGFVMVPVEPTEAMRDQAEYVKDSCSTCHLTAWRAMIAARPQIEEMRK